ncbi:MAG: MBL fold metallo-hydrolase [Anaerolineales bacterium]|nr:MBL fold metallo-hydrolase [Anaerolineales bacterium]MCB9126359.1 MBL fold metallo-hydrolase [Ardenticatenales bacterium]
MPLRITSYGAAGMVTGSAHLVELDNAKLLIDCGLFQGPPDVRDLNQEPLGFDPDEVDAVLLTHGHTDHVGRMPLLVQQGYDGPIYTTRATRDVARLILVDGARIQAEDYRRRRRRAGDDEGDIPPPLYTEQDVYETLDLIVPIRMDEMFKVMGVEVTFRHVGHILGSAYIALKGQNHRLVASGDIGHWGPHVVPDPQLPDEADVMLLESTYGDTIHPPMSEATASLIDIIHRTVRAGGNVLIPSFALERTQDVLHQLRIANDQRRLPNDIKVFLDSPLGIRFTQLYRRYPEQLSDTVQNYLRQGESPFRWGNVHFTIASRDSYAINDQNKGAVIMAGSGMATGGRILRHLKENLEREESAVVFVGYQAEGTLGRQLVEGADEVEIDGEPFKVRAEIHEIDGFSAHADQRGLSKWAAAAGNPQIQLIHGEPEVAAVLQAYLQENHGLTAVVSDLAKAYDF